MIQIDLYKKGEGILEKFSPLNNISDVKAFIKNVKTYGANLEIFQSKSSVKE